MIASGGDEGKVVLYNRRSSANRGMYSVGVEQVYTPLCYSLPSAAYPSLLLTPLCCLPLSATQDNMLLRQQEESDGDEARGGA